MRYKIKKDTFNCYWNEKDGWHFSIGEKHLWQTKHNFVVAEIAELEDGNKIYKNHEWFKDLEIALNYMRTGKKT